MPHNTNKQRYNVTIGFLRKNKEFWFEYFRCTHFESRDAKIPILGTSVTIIDLLLSIIIPETYGNQSYCAVYGSGMRIIREVRKELVNYSIKIVPGICV